MIFHRRRLLKTIFHNITTTHVLPCAHTHIIPLRPKLIMMSASPSMMRLNDSGVTSLHTLKALKKASFMTSSSRSGVYPRILQGKHKVSFTLNQDKPRIMKTKLITVTKSQCNQRHHILKDIQTYQWFSRPLVRSWKRIQLKPANNIM